MKPEQMYHHLREIAEKLNIAVLEQNLRKSGPQVRSGFCKVKDKKMFILDKHISLQEKNSLLASFIAEISHEDIYMMPAVREFIQFNSDPKNISHRESH